MTWCILSRPLKSVPRLLTSSVLKSNPVPLATSPMMISHRASNENNNEIPFLFLQKKYNAKHLNNLLDSSDEFMNLNSRPKPYLFEQQRRDSDLNNPSILLYSDDTQNSNNKSTNNNDKPDEETLSQVSSQLAYDLANFFVRKPNYNIYDPLIVFENRITGKTFNGLPHYANQMNLLKVFGNVRFVFVRFVVMKMRVDPDEGVISIRWKIIVMTFSKMLLNYFPKRMWLKENLNNNAVTWEEGISRFHVNKEGKIFKHIADNKHEDKDKEPINTNVEIIKDKLKKLKNPADVAPNI